MVGSAEVSTAMQIRFSQMYNKISRKARKLQFGCDKKDERIKELEEENDFIAKTVLDINPSLKDNEYYYPWIGLKLRKRRNKGIVYIY